jgi:hypothetical protein
MNLLLGVIGLPETGFDAVTLIIFIVIITGVIIILRKVKFKPPSSGGNK